MLSLAHNSTQAGQTAGRTATPDAANGPQTPLADACEKQGPARDFACALRADNLCFAYPGGEKVLENISFTLPQGRLLAVIGPNGGGKTTLLKLILGLLAPTAGDVRVFGQSPARMGGSIGYVPQFSTLQRDFPATALDMTLMGAARPSARGGVWPTDAAARKKAMEYLDVLGLAACARQPVGALSGGQRQRALVARALMSCPGNLCESGAGPLPFLLLLDEPTASIDPEGKFCFYEFLGRLRGRVGILVVSHDLFLVSPFFDAVLFVNRTLTPLASPVLTPEILSKLFGSHMHHCPVGDIQHPDGLAQHGPDCSHPACREAPLPRGADCGREKAENRAADCGGAQANHSFVHTANSGNGEKIPDAGDGAA